MYAELLMMLRLSEQWSPKCTGPHKGQQVKKCEQPESRRETAGTAGNMQNSQAKRMKRVMMKMKVHNTLVRQCLGEIIGTFVLLVSFSSNVLVFICYKSKQNIWKEIEYVHVKSNTIIKQKYVTVLEDIFDKQYE